MTAALHWLAANWATAIEPLAVLLGLGLVFLLYAACAVGGGSDAHLGE